MQCALFRLAQLNGTEMVKGKKKSVAQKKRNQVSDELFVIYMLCLTLSKARRNQEQRKKIDYVPFRS